MSVNKRLFQYGKTTSFFVVAVGILALLTAACIVTQAYFIASIVNAAFLLKRALAQVQTALLILLAVLLMRAALVWCGESITNFVACTVKGDLRQRLFAHLCRLGPLYLRGERSGEIVNTLADGVEALDAYYIKFLPQLVATMFIPTVILSAVFKIDAVSGIVLLVTWPILPIFMILIGLQANAMTRKRWRLLSQLSAHFLDVLQGLTTLKLFGRAPAQETLIRQMSERYASVTMKVLRVAFLSAFVMEMGATLSTGIVAVEIGLRLLYGSIPFEPAFFVLLLAPEFFLPLRALGTQFHASMDSSASAERIFEILETPPECGRALAAAERAPVVVRRSLALREVHYSYPGEERTGREALQGVSFEVRPGQKVALVGANGAGKSTIAGLLLRFMQPTRGEITADGRSILDFTAQAWREAIAWQPQSPYVFNASVAENIRLGRSDATLEEVVSAARAADMHDFIQALPRGYDTVIGERGARLSGGQVQKLSLARTFLKRAPILLLDEATSTLDAEGEEQVQRAIKRATGERIVLVIAQRLHTIRDADRIIVLQEGRVVASGGHAQLLERSPLYQKLVRAYEAEEVLA